MEQHNYDQAEWKHVSEIDNVPDCVTSVHVDTRDFHIHFTTTPTDWTRNDSNLNLSKIHGAVLYDRDRRFRIETKDILPLLKNLESWTGGQAEWRCFNLKSWKSTIGWFKYIRLFRVPDTDDWVITDGYQAVRASEFTEDNIDKEYLNTY